MKEWVDALFDKWYNSRHACPLGEERCHQATEPGVGWDHDIIFKFFEVKDRDYCLKFPIEDGIN